MFISQVSSKLRDKHCQIIRISTLPKRNFQTRFYGSVNRISHYTSVFRVQNPSYPTAESGSTAMFCVYVVNAVASAPGKKK